MRASVSRAWRSMAVSTSRVCDELRLRLAPELAQPPLLALGRAMDQIGRLGREARGVRRAALLCFLSGQRAEPGAFGEPARRGDRALRGDDEAIPPPQVAFPRYEPLAGLQGALQAHAIGMIDEADLAQPARELGGARDVRGERLDAGGQGRVRLARAIDAPMHRRLRHGRRIEVVAERGRKCHLVARCDLDLIENGREVAVAGGFEELGERFDLGLELAGGEPGFGRRIALGPGVGGG